ncbi:MAG: gliding motility-associated C-terminal domain-containing protein [Bacteroidia bacterium]|nr:gliding motility-associated C-terminal domain-containing protein [Bacteroidia bacterium]MDW8014432.1 gliding motility-associated C-terminal domain-containing protein [Bacteroidia bacterium]
MYLLFSQPLAVNTGVQLFLEPRGVVWCGGGWENQSGGTFQNQGTVYITGDVQNDDAGQLFVPAPSPGTLVLAGGLQTLRGSFPIRTDTLILVGSVPKVLQTDLYIDGVLDLGDAELRTQSRTAAIRNPEPGAIRRQGGFVSSDVGGALERLTDRSATYLFPVGGHTPLRYRPVEIVPTSSAAHRYAVRLANADPTAEGRPRDQRPPELCEINPLYDHYIHRVAGSDAAEIRIFYDASDPVTGRIAQWKAALWVPTPAQPIPSGWSLPNWTDFSDPYFAFSVEQLLMTLTASADTVEVGEAVTFTASSQPQPATSYTWSFGEGTVRSGGGSQTFAYSEAGTYTVSVSALPCSDTAERVIVVRPSSFFTVPNAFSPNGDGINDVWQITVTGELRSLRWRIYDRWGIPIAQGEGPSTRWDGTRNGQPCPEGVYVYVIEAESVLGTKTNRTGTLTLLR